MSQFPNTPAEGKLGNAAANEDGIRGACGMASHSPKNTVRRIMIYSFLDQLAYSVGLNHVYTPLVYLLFARSNTIIGYMAAANGVAEVIAAVISAIIADRLNRTSMTRLGAVVGAAAILVTIYSLTGSSASIAGLMIGNMLFGIYTGCAMPAVEALFADVVPAGNRDAIYSKKYVLETFSGVIGALVSVAMFLFLGNDWGIEPLKFIMFTALFLHIIAVVLLLSLVDHEPLSDNEGEHDNMLNSNEPESPGRTPSAEDLLPVDNPMCSWGEWKWKPMRASLRLLPYFVTAQDIIVCLGSGMTTKYTDLFLIVELGLSPVAVATIAALEMLGSVWGSHMMAVAFQKGWCSRVKALFFVRVVTPFMLLYVCLAEKPPWNSLWLIVPVFVIRYAASNCTVNTSRALLMDCVPRRQRAKWNAIESVNNVSWGGSAMIGGWLADAHSYRYTFLITVAFYFASAALLLLVVQTPDPAKTRKENASQGQELF